MQWVREALEAMGGHCAVLINENESIDVIDIRMEEVDVHHYERTLRIVVKRNLSQEGADETARSLYQEHRTQDPRP